MVTSWNELPFCEVVGDEFAEMYRDDNLEYNVYSSMCYNPFESVGDLDATPINPDSTVMLTMMSNKEFCIAHIWT